MANKPEEKTAKLHTVYRDAGPRLPSVTTVLSILQKPALIHWAWRLGTEGKDYKKVRDITAEVGTLAHAIILEHLGGSKVDYSIYSDHVRQMAENSFLSYLEWERRQTGFKSVLAEQKFSSDALGFGGTIDDVAEINSTLSLLDFKTGKGIFDSHRLQVAAYWLLLKEAGYDVQRIVILNIPRSEDENFIEAPVRKIEQYADMFLKVLEVYKASRKLEYRF